jgi:hypothetical protein
MKTSPKPFLAITFWARILEDLILIFYIWVSITKKEGTMKKSNLKNTLLLLLGIW